MIARLLISPSINKRRDEINKILACNLEGYRVNHPDLLYISAGEKLGIAEARKIKEHFALKPYSAKGRIVIIEDAGDLTHEAQNALLKTLEEPPKEAILILGAGSDANLLSTILSRCQIIHLNTDNLVGRVPRTYEVYTKDLEKLLDSSIQERFEYVEKLKDKGEFLHFLVHAFREILRRPKRNLTEVEVINFLKELLEAEKWAKQNVNIRAILEYLMLVMPGRK